MSGNGDSSDLDAFESFLGQDLTAVYRLSWPYSNPAYTTEWERFDNKSHVATSSVDEGGIRCEHTRIFRPVRLVPNNRYCGTCEFRLVFDLQP